MKRCSTIEEVRGWRAVAAQNGASVALVPTMGALHEGHLRLIEAATARADEVVVSVFVNPLQFAPGDDFDRYPRDLTRDAGLVAERGATMLFAPDVSELYRNGSGTHVVPGPTASRWEGVSRPEHFEGVLTVVVKLFNIIAPEFAVFGRKDLQQSLVIAAMVRDLDFDIKLVTVPTVREPDGLALSSRNSYLTPSERSDALLLSRGLAAARQAWQQGECDPGSLGGIIRDILGTGTGMVTEYIAVVDRDTLEPVRTAVAGTALAIAARVGSTRLIDNTILGDEEF